MEDRKKNPMKELAVQLAHAMDDQIRTFQDETLLEWQVKEIRENLTQVNIQIIKNGYDAETMLRLAEEYKTLKVTKFVEWIYS